MKKNLLFLLITFCILYILWPYYSIYKFYNSTKESNVEYISNNVNWDSLRNGFKNDFKIIINKSFGKEKNNIQNKIFSKLFESSIVDILLKDIVTPENLILLVNNPDEYNKLLKKVIKNPVKKINYENNSKNFDQLLKIRQKINYAFFINLNKFRIDFNQEEYQIIVDLKLDNFKWKINRIYLPIDTIASKINN